MGPIDIDFIKEGTSRRDIELFLGPVRKDQVQTTFELHDKLVIAYFMHQAGIFRTISDARHNGWNKAIPSGFSTFVVGKKKSKLTILNIIDQII